MNSNYQAMERITGLCHPTRANNLTGANYPYHSAEPSTILFDEDGYAYKADEPLPRHYAVDWPAGVMNINAKVEA